MSKAVEQYKNTKHLIMLQESCQRLKQELGAGA